MDGSCTTQLETNVHGVLAFLVMEGTNYCGTRICKWELVDRRGKILVLRDLLPLRASTVTIATSWMPQSFRCLHVIRAHSSRWLCRWVVKPSACSRSLDLAAQRHPVRRRPPSLLPSAGGLDRPAVSEGGGQGRASRQHPIGHPMLLPCDSSPPEQSWKSATGNLTFQSSLVINYWLWSEHCRM